MSVEPTWPGPAPEDIAVWTLVQASHVVARRFREALGEAGLTPTQFGVLLELDLRPGLANGEVARAVLVTPQSMSDLLVSLQRLGYIERDASAGHGRRVPAQLTADGRAALRRCATAVELVETSLGLDREQAAQLNALLRLVLATAT
ncbi:putative transcriptional regulator, MarR family protein [Actinoplanes philippinensis]|uniref:DNA-binding transcriptional regulator, MarR family n=1 Tax=Actinoplanes philippinensis TaxID=35752 RepID=A0A1I2MFK8_9ACTN|nr:MarR family transcriptional regulator [Actinoplanes philippinensis]GIE83156.1 putative transcriptional regulator, MarR family protein [Actinoplanes philippinensis]SFF90274.1 DNA-binding transcriptional regulator, MarR family [Actinoplanes philippinensis]